MIQKRAYELDDDEELRPILHWQTWLLWLLVMAIYAGWIYVRITSTTNAPIDWEPHLRRIFYVGVATLHLKLWIDVWITRHRRH